MSIRYNLIKLFTGIKLSLCHYFSLFAFNLILVLYTLIFFSLGFSLKLFYFIITGIEGFFPFGNNVIDRLEQKFADQHIPDQNIKNGKDQIKV